MKVRFLHRDAVISRLTDICRALAREFPVDMVLLFGSLARGDHSARSDGDLLVVLERSPLPPHMRVAPMYSVFREAPVPVDIIAWTTDELRRRLDQGDLFARRVAGEGLVLFRCDRSGIQEMMKG